MGAVTTTPQASTTASPSLSPSVKSGDASPFFMTVPQWQTVQCYVRAGLQAPTSASDAIAKLGILGAEADKLTALWSTYATIESHCAAFNNTALPKAVSLAGDIVDYGNNKAPVFFQGLKSIASQVKSGQLTAAAGQADLTAVVTNLKNDAKTRSASAALAQEGIKLFVDLTTSDQTLLTSAQGVYTVEYNEEQDDVSKYQKEISNDLSDIAKYSGEFLADMSVLASSIVYAEVFPIGTIAAIVAMGIFIPRAVDALHHVEAAQADMQSAKTQLQAAIQTKQSLDLVNGSIASLLNDLTPALAVLKTAEGLWSDLEDNFGKLQTQLNALGIEAIEALDVDTALADWQALANEADVFRNAVFITVKSLDQIKAEYAANPHAFDPPGKTAALVEAAPMTTQTTPTASLAPAITPDPNSPFFMSSTDWQSVQCYVETGLQLPTSANDAVTKLGLGAGDAAAFADLWAAYNTIEGHCANFNNNIYPQTVSLAGDLADYGHNKAPTFYAGLTQIVAGMTSGSIDNATGAAELQAVLADLQKDAASRATTVDSVVQAINGFITTTTQDQGLIAPIQTRYDNEYEGEAGQIASFQSEISADNVEIASYTAQYKQDCIIAETTPTYCWVPVVGVVAAAVVAGVYGARAVDALKHIRDAQNDLTQTSAKLNAALQLQKDLKLATDSLAGIVTALNGALPVLQKAKGVWNSLATDIGNILKDIASVPDPSQTIPIIEQLDIDTAIKAWGRLADEADQFRVNAFIVVQTEAQVSANLAANPNAYELPKAA